MTSTLATTSAHTYWGIALGIGFAAATATTTTPRTSPTIHPVDAAISAGTVHRDVLKLGRGPVWSSSSPRFPRPPTGGPR